MKQKKRVGFFKYQGSGNDFILIEDYHNFFFTHFQDKISTLCNRHYGIGADGFILLQSSLIADCKMRIFNPDGNEASMCGNGLRCVIKHLESDHVTVETNEGICIGENHEDVRATIPIAEEILSPVALIDGNVGHLINTGVPHLIIPVSTLEVDDFEEKARVLRYHEMFSPHGVNVSYIKSVDEKIYIRTYERGVEKETLSCGTAAAACAYVVRKHETTKQSLYKIYPKSNEILQFSFDSLENIWMRGPAEKIFKGELLYTIDKKEKRDSLVKR